MSEDFERMEQLYQQRLNMTNIEPIIERANPVNVRATIPDLNVTYLSEAEIINRYSMELDEIPVVETKSKSELNTLKAKLKQSKVDKERLAKLKAEQELIATKIAMIKSVAEEVYPGLWDFAEVSQTRDFCYDSSNKYRLVIHFPEIDITNANNLHHTIKDLYVLFFFNKDLKLFGSSIYGNRATRTYNEVRVQYFHSHRQQGNSENNPYWAVFCLGGATPISIAFLNASHQTTEDNLRHLLYILDIYVGWESLEGGPYCRMEKVLNYNQGGSTSVWSPNNSDVKIAYKQYIANNESIEGITYTTTDIMKPIKINTRKKEFINQIKPITSKLGTINQHGEWVLYNQTTTNVQSQIDSYNINSKSLSKCMTYISIIRKFFY